MEAWMQHTLVRMEEEEEERERERREREGGDQPTGVVDGLHAATRFA